VTKRKYYIDKRYTKMGGCKIAKNPMKIRFSITYQRTKVKKLGSPKNKKAEKT
jgi:hypothetical protein